MRNLLLALIVFLGVTLQAQENSPQVFVDALTQALNAKDKESFYRLVCFDGMDEEWKKMGLKGFDSMFTWLEAGRKFSIATQSPDPEKIKAREYKGGQI